MKSSTEGEAAAGREHPRAAAAPWELLAVSGGSVGVVVGAERVSRDGSGRFTWNTTIEAYEQVISALHNGDTKLEACRAAGISKSTLRRRCLLDPEYAERVKQACRRAYRRACRERGERPRPVAPPPARGERGRFDRKPIDRELELILIVLKGGCTKTEACRIAEVPRSTLQRHCNADPEYAARVEAAYRAGRSPEVQKRRRETEALPPLEHTLAPYL